VTDRDDNKRLPSGLGPILGPVGSAVLGLAILALGLFELFIAQIMGPGNSDELVSGGVLVVPWFGLPLIAIGCAGLAVVRRRDARLAPRALVLAAACVGAWMLLAAVV
jgi:hypothetical protein